jgi:PAS domain S-box-containing protein
LIAGSVEPKTLLIEDAKNDPRFVAHPASTAFSNIGCYLGVPVTLLNGSFFGTLCAVDPEPRHLTQQQADMLAVQARLVATTIERDRELREREQAEQKLRRQRDYNLAIASSLTSGLYALDQEGRLTFMNPAAERALGWTEAELLGKNMHEAVHYQRADGTRLPEKECPLLAAIRPGHIVRIDDDAFTRKDGTTFAVAYTSHPLTEDGQVTGAVVSFRDITEHKRAEQVRSFLAAIVESSNDAIIGKTLDGTITSWNWGAQKLYGYSNKEVVGQSISMLVPPTYPNDAPEILEVIKRGERLVDYETLRQTKEGNLVDVSLTVSPVKDSYGKVVAASTIARDITERKRAEAELERAFNTQRAANEQLERVNKIRRDFVSVVSHEFRTALTGIQGFSQMMRDEDFSAEEMREFASDIYEDATRLTRMISEMLDLDRMESGRMTLGLDRLDLSEILARVTENARLNAPRHRIRLRVDENVPKLSGDRDKLTQVTANLLSNAVKYSPEGGQITVESRLEGEVIHVLVQDEGVGIRPEAREKLFEPYSRVESENTRYIQGTGLGLAISRQIIRLHGGDIWVDSKPGEGSTFHFTVPLNPSRPTTA